MDRLDELATIRRAYAKQIMGVAERTESARGGGIRNYPTRRFSRARPVANHAVAGRISHDTRSGSRSPLRKRGGRHHPGAGDQQWGTVATRKTDFHCSAASGTARRSGRCRPWLLHPILAELVGATGKVTAIEFDADLAARAADNLRSRPNVVVVHGDATIADFDPVDLIYVSAGVTRPPDKWLDSLRDRGQLLVPLTTNNQPDLKDPTKFQRQGAMFLFTRRGSSYSARWIMAAWFIPCESARDQASEAALAKALAAGGWETVTGLHRGSDVPENSCWLRGPDWCLTRDVH